MVVMTAKVSKAKLIAIFCIVAAVICIVAYALFGGGGENAAPDAAANAASNESRIAFLAAYGWQVDETPTQTQDVRIPKEMNEVFTAYNELQRSQGYDLSQFAGETVQRYVYQITNYANASAPVYASLLVRDGTVIGGDITSSAGSGMMHGFEAPAGSQSLAAAAETPNEGGQTAAEDAAPDTQQTTAPNEQTDAISDSMAETEEALLPAA